MKVMMVSSMEKKCGVAEYTSALKEALDGQATVKIAPIPPMKNRRDLKQIAAQINEADVAHIQYHPDFFGLWRNPWMIHQFYFLLKLIQIPSIITVHDLTHCLVPKKVNGIKLRELIYNIGVVRFINGTSYGQFLLGRFLNSADHLIVHTTASKLFLESLGISALKVSVLYPGIPDIVLPNHDGLPEQFEWRDRRIMTIFGFITPSKGYEIVLKAMKYLPHDVVLLIAGGIRVDSYIPYLKELKELIASLGLEERVRITGHLDDAHIGIMLSSSHIILLPYRSTSMTGFSYALSYALASKRPVMTSDTIYFSEIEQKSSAMRTFKNQNP